MDKNNSSSLILFIGPPGSGKGTQSVLFNKEFGYQMFSIGSFLRSDVFDDKIKKKINAGTLVSSSTIFNKIDKSIFEKNIIFDGFPRTLEQAIFFDEFIKKNNLKIKAIVEFIVAKKTLFERIMSRKICVSCDAPHKKNAKVCTCGHSIFQKRVDDTVEIFEKRYLTYQRNVSKIYDYYKNNNEYIVSFDINFLLTDQIPYMKFEAEGNILEVFNRLKIFL